MPRAFLQDPPPESLSAYGLFTDAIAQLPAEGLLPYALVSPLHSDYSDKFRFVYVPPGHKVDYRSRGVFQLPVGSALIKTFAYPSSGRPGSPLRLLETRLLVHLAGGWQSRVYVWNEAQTEAHYRVAGRTIRVDWLKVGGVAQPLRYRVPNLNQCTSCHSEDGRLVPLGPRARNLDRLLDYGRFGLKAGIRNQLSLWSELGILKGLPEDPQHMQVVDWQDEHAPLNARARAYLDINCGHCHNPRGTANTSGLYLHLEQEYGVHLGVGKRPVAAGRGTGGRLFALAPGEPDRSILLYRMASDRPGERMPEISLTRPHAEGMALIRDWILSLD